MIVSDFMTKNPLYVTPDTSVTEARAKMLKAKISKLPVLDSQSRLVGIITKNDLIKADPSAATTLDIYEMGYLLSKLKVEKVMTKKLITVQQDEVVEECARIMVDNQIGCLPIMKGDLLVGIITETDLFNVFIKMFGARHKGVRASFEITDKAGELAKISQAIAQADGNIVSVVTNEGSDISNRSCTIKVLNMKEDKFREILENNSAKIFDLREI